MCGLVGVIGDINFQDTKVFNQLLFVDTLRGAHSTGVATNDIDNVVTTYKKALSAPDFLQLKHGANIASNTSGDFLLGHNRYATQGAVNDINAHPFTYGNVTLAHNGTLGDQTTLPDHKDFTVDSENIAYAMGLTKDPEEVISVLKGAFALSWYNDHTMEFYLVRNEERPLWIAKNAKRDTYYYASERHMLEAILCRNDITYSLEELPVGVLLSFNLKDTKGLKPTQRTVKIQPKYIKPQLGYQGYYGNSSAWSKTVKSKPSHPLNNLTKYDLKVGDEIEFYSEGVKAKHLKGKNKKPLLGISTDGFHLEVKCFNAPNPAIAGYYSAYVKSMIKGGKDNKEDIVICDTPFITEVIEDDINNKDKKEDVEKLLISKQVTLSVEEYDDSPCITV
jgi:predicted glutamine amidotransferase